MYILINDKTGEYYKTISPSNSSPTFVSNFSQAFVYKDNHKDQTAVARAKQRKRDIKYMNNIEVSVFKVILEKVEV